MVTGIVTIIAIRICVPTDHVTFLGFSAAPTPSTDIVMTWVDDTGAPARVYIAMEEDEKNCESKEWMGSILKILRPRVFMIRHPPLIVPRASRIAQMILAQSGTSASVMSPAEKSASAMMPSCFWESFAPFEKAIIPAAPQFRNTMGLLTVLLVLRKSTPVHLCIR